MKELFTKLVSESKLGSSLSRNILDSLMLLFACTFLLWYAQYHWKRRKLYKMAAQRDGPITFPLIGSALYFVTSTGNTLQKVWRIYSNFQTPTRVWLGQRLFFLVWKPRDMDVIMNSPQALKKEDLYKLAEIVVGKGLFSAPVPKWKKNRKIIMPTFNQKILDGFVEVFAEQSEILVQQLKKLSGKGNFDIFHYVSRCTLDIICETAMGTRVDAQTKEFEFIHWSNKAMEIIYTRMFTIFYHYDFIFNFTSLAKEQLDCATKIHEFTGAVVREKRSAYQAKLARNKELPEALIEDESSKRKTFLQLLIELSEEGARFTDEEMRDEVNTFMIAGSDTTASVNSYVFIMLGMFQDVQEKVYQEVMDVLGPDKEIEHADLKNLQYLERVIKETMRLFPVGPLIVRELTEDVKLESCTLPAGSSTVLGIMYLHRNAEYWPNPLKFDPDRFLPEEVAKRDPYSWLPFSGGPRNCIGLKYAMLAMKSLISTVIRKYRFHTAYKNIEDIELKADLVLKPIKGYKASLELRL